MSWILLLFPLFFVCLFLLWRHRVRLKRRRDTLSTTFADTTSSMARGPGRINPAPKLRAVKGRRFGGEIRLPMVSRGQLRKLAFVPIAGYVGFNGSGKSLAAAATCMVHLELGRPVLSTMRLLDYDNPRPCEDDEGCQSADHGMPGHMQAHPLWIPLTDFRQLFDAYDCHILLDEVTGVADAREHAAMPVQVANFLPQLRRRGVTLAWTTIGWSFADIRIRRITLAAVHAAGLMPVYQPDSLWPQNRLFLWRVYDARSFDEFESHKREQMRATVRSWFWRPGSIVEKAYDTSDSVLSLGAANEAGMCMVCGGKRLMARCSCGEHGRAARKRSEDGAAADTQLPDLIASPVLITDSLTLPTDSRTPGR